MNELTLTVLLAQGGGGEGWMDLLFILVVAAFWLLGTIGKTIQARKGAPQQRPRQDEAGERKQGAGTWQERLAGKLEEMQRAAESKTRQAAEHARKMHEQLGGGRQGGQTPRPAGAQSPGGRLTVRQGPRGESVMVYEQAQAKNAKEAQQARRPSRPLAPRPGRRRTVKAATVQPEIDTGIRPLEPIVSGLAAMDSPAVKPLDAHATKLTSPPQATGYEPATLIDPTDPDALRKAVLHYEILGKPVSLRDMSESSPRF